MKTSIRENIESVIARALKDGEVFAEDVNDTMTLLGFHDKELRLRMMVKVANTLDAIVEANQIVTDLARNPRQTFYRAINQGKYLGAATAQHFTTEYSERVVNDMAYLCGLSALGNSTAA